MAPIRSFIAIDLAPEIRFRLAAIQEELRTSIADARWVRPEGVHLTLKFLGMVDEGKLPAIAGVLSRCVSRLSPFTITVRTLGVFPGESNPRVIWAGVYEESGRLPELQESLERELAAIGFKEEKRDFTPHLTLARLKSPREKKAVSRQLEILGDAECGTFEADEVCLFKSELRPQGALYTLLQAFQLNG